MKRIRRGGPRIRRSADVPMAIVIVAAVAAAALRAAARRPEQPAPVRATAPDDRPQSAATAGLHRIAGQETAKLPGPPGRPDSWFEQMRYVFHELHADGHHALCEVCGN
jgi:hypothetical protein